MYKFFVGIDITKYSHQAAFMNVEGEKSAPDVAFDNTSEGFELLSLSLNGFGREETVIGLEATGHYWLALYAFLTDNGLRIMKFFKRMMFESINYNHYFEGGN